MEPMLVHQDQESCSQGLQPNNINRDNEIKIPEFWELQMKKLNKRLIVVQTVCPSLRGFCLQRQNDS